MKKSFVFLAAVPFIISCGYEIPETISVKTNAEYNFIVGERKQSLSEYLSVETLKQSMNPEGSEFSFDIYDYYPKADRQSAERGGYSSQKFLADCSLYEIPIDIGEYLDQMNFSESLKDMSFVQTFDVPSLAVDSYKEPLELPDLNEKIRTSADLAFSPIEIPHGINGSIPEESCPSQTINVRSPEFEELTFYSGFLELMLECQDTPIAKTDLTVYLNTMDGTEITHTSGVNLNQKSNTISLPLTGKTLYQTMNMKVSGTSQDSGSPGSFSTYTVSARISDDAKISRAAGLSMKIDLINVNQRVIIGTDDAFVECEIGDKSAGERSVLSIETKLPDGWSGITAVSKEIRLEGALTAENNEFDTTSETGNYLLNRSLPLKGKVYKKGDIQVVGNLNIKLTNATVVMPDGKIPSIEISTTCDITKVNSMTVDLEKYESPIKTKIEEKEPLPSEVTDVIEKMELLPSGMNVKYFNTLPEGNDITFTVNSGFFGISNSTKAMKGGTSEEKPGTMEFLGVKKPVKPAETPEIDFTAEMQFPGASAGNSYVKLRDIEIGKSYTVSAKVTPVFDWESVTLKTDATAVNGNVDTGLNISEIFNSLTEELGDDSFMDRIALTSIPLYVYAVVPRAAEDAEDKINFEFTGTMKAVAYDDAGNPIEDNAVIIEQDKILSTFTKLQRDSEDNSIVIGFGESGENSVKASANIADLFNSRNAKNIKIEYNFMLGSKKQGEAKPTVEISKEDLDKLEGTDSVSIRLHARLVLPLELEILKDGDSSDPVTIDVMNLIDSDSDDSSDDDLFGRDEATDIDDIKKYIDAIEWTGIRYKMDNKILRYSATEKDVKLVLTMKDESGSSVYSNEISLADSSNDWDSFKIKTEDVEKLLETYPVRSDIRIELPVGELIIPRETEIGLNLALSVKTDGTIELFSR